jgi:hypothetical protein
MSNTDTERYYLFPGQGGRGRRQKVKKMLLWGILVGLGTGLLVGGVFYLFNYLGRPWL